MACRPDMCSVHGSSCRRPSRAYQVLLFAMMAAVGVPLLSAVVKHYHLGLLTVKTPELQRRSLGELGVGPFGVADTSFAKDSGSAFPLEHLGSEPMYLIPRFFAAIGP